MSDQPVAQTSTWQHTVLTKNKHPCPWRKFEPTNPASEGPQTYALDRAATGTGNTERLGNKNGSSLSEIASLKMAKHNALIFSKRSKTPIKLINSKIDVCSVRMNNSLITGIKTMAHPVFYKQATFVCVPIHFGTLLDAEKMSNDHSVRIFCSLALTFLPWRTIPKRNAEWT